MAITLTEQAARQVYRYLERRVKGIGLRFGVRTTGCSGLAYKLEYVDDMSPEDAVFESFGVKVFVDPKSLRLLDGAVLDYDTSLLSRGFVFDNPHASSTCGCGTSFSVEQRHS